jgi:hypothetical protein
MKKIAIISFLVMLVAFWVYPCQAVKVTYFSSDGSQITRTEYDQLADDKEEAYQRSKKKWGSWPYKQSSRPSAKSGRAVKFSEIRESDIRHISNKMINSSTRGDLSGMIAYLAPSFRVDMDTAQGKLSLTRAEYVAMLNEIWSLVQSYKVNIESQKITVAQGKQKATNEVVMVESTTLTDGMALNVRTHQKSTYEIVDGKIMVTHTKAREQPL